MSKIVCLGISVADVIVKTVDTIPEKGKLGLVDKIELHTGGCAVNAAIDLAKLGEEVAIITLVGKDGFGDFITEKLIEARVDIEGLKASSMAGTSSSVALLNSDSERTFIHYLGTNAIFSEEDIDMDVIEKSEILFIAGALLMPAFDGEPTGRILKSAQKMGKYTVLDTAWDSTGRWWSVIKHCIPYLDLFIPSIEEAQMISGKQNEVEIAQDFLNLGAKNVVIKLGSRGCFVKNHVSGFYVDAFKVKAVDTTGAGDSFVAGFITGLSNGWDFRKCATFANAVGAHCVMKMGASNGIKSKEEILTFIKGAAGL